ncbi:MAG: hypothetical protein HN348_10080 [Proteobacteria bacterium]|nr:hypothetical protein [Pseudomonadota bacterium]
MTKERIESEGLVGWLRLGCVGLIMIVGPVWLILAAILAPHTQTREFEPFWEWLLRSSVNVGLGCWWSLPWMGTLTILLCLGLILSLILRWFGQRQDLQERKSMDSRTAQSVVLPESAWDSIVVKHTRGGVAKTDEVEPEHSTSLSLEE